MEFRARPCLCVYFHGRGRRWHALKDNGQIDVHVAASITERSVVIAEAWLQNVASKIILLSIHCDRDRELLNLF